MQVLAFGALHQCPAPRRAFSSSLPQYLGLAYSPIRTKDHSYILQPSTPGILFFKSFSTTTHLSERSTSDADHAEGISSSDAKKDIWANLIDGADIKSNAASLPVRKQAPLPPKTRTSLGVSPPSSSSSPSSTSPFPRRQSLTLQESTVFADIFEKLFEARNVPKRSQTRDPLSDVGIGLRPGETRQPLESLFGKLKRRSKRFHDPSETHLLIEQQRMEMGSLGSDRELLEWAAVNVFNQGDPEAFPNKIPSSLEQTNKRKTDESANATSSSNSDSPAPPSETSESSTPTKPSPENPSEAFALQTTTYPSLLLTLIFLLRDKFRDPHLALSIFHHARHLSVPSYVFGCTTEVYNELIATKWFSLKDLEGVVESLGEMKVNGVRVDGGTVRLLRVIRRKALEGLSLDDLESEEDVESTNDSVRSLIAQIDAIMEEESDLEARRAKPKPKRAGLRGTAPRNEIDNTQSLTPWRRRQNEDSDGLELV